MFKIFLWRFSFEMISLLKRLGFKGPVVKYFTYGGNLDPKVLEHRQIKILARQNYVLENFRFAFNHRIPFEGAAMASIEPAPQSKVFGVIYDIKYIDLLRLDCFEAAWFIRGYLRKLFLTEENDRVYYYESNRKKEGLKPPKAYIDKILNGYRLAYPEQLDLINKLAAMPSMPNMDPMATPHFLNNNYERFGAVLAPYFAAYDRRCVKLFALLIFRPSIFEK